MAEENRVQWVYSSRDNAELAERYDQWAKDYDTDLEDEFGWRGPQAAAEAFSRNVPKEAKVLDAGAGTGLVGVELAKRGYSNLVAMDLSTGMLEESRKKNVYQQFHQMVMGEPLDYPDAAFDAIISVGVLTVGHAPASSLDELVRITKPGGYIVFSLRPDVHSRDDFQNTQRGLEEADKWRLVERGDPFQVLPKGEPDVYHQVWVYQVTG